MKTAICNMKVPAVLSPTGEEIQVGETIEYKKEIFSNGEHHYVLADNNQVPSVFFEI